MMDELIKQMCIRAAESIEQMVAARLSKMLDKYFRSEIKLTFSETEAAKALNVSRSTLAAWRKDKIISCSRYPQAKSDDLSDMYVYTAADLLSFVERYKVATTTAKNVFEMSPVISLAGPEVISKAA